MDYHMQKEILRDMMSRGEIEPKEFDLKMAECDRKINNENGFLKAVLAEIENDVSMKTLEEIITKMMEYVCDTLCKYPCKEEQEQLDIICADCEMGQFVCDILNAGEELERYRATGVTPEQTIEIDRNTYRGAFMDRFMKTEHGGG